MPVQTVEGWSEFSADIPTDALAVFKKSLAGLAGVSYHPVAYASQVVTGINYLFFCNSKIVYPGATNQAAMVHIEVPVTGDPHITEIQKVIY